MQIPFISKLKGAKEEKPSQVSTSGTGSDVEQKGDGYDDSAVRYLTWRTSVLGIVASMGGFVFGYSTGQISGFTTMNDFSLRFGEWNEATAGYGFSDVRSGLIVGLVSSPSLFLEDVKSNRVQSYPLEHLLALYLLHR